MSGPDRLARRVWNRLRCLTGQHDEMYLQISVSCKRAGCGWFHRY